MGLKNTKQLGQGVVCMQLHTTALGWYQEILLICSFFLEKSTKIKVNELFLVFSMRVEVFKRGVSV